MAEKVEKVIHCNDAASFDKTMKAAGDKLVIVDFSATWCGPCQAIKPKYHEMAEANEDVVFIEIDVDENEDTSEKYRVNAMPTFLFFKKGEKVGEMQGANENQLREMLAQHK